MSLIDASNISSFKTGNFIEDTKEQTANLDKSATINKVIFFVDKHQVEANAVDVIVQHVEGVAPLSCTTCWLRATLSIGAQTTSFFFF